MKIVVVGAGYVGLSLACLLAKKHDITITDIDKNKINLLKAKISPIKDKDIQKSLKKLNISQYKYAKSGNKC